MSFGSSQQQQTYNPKIVEPLPPSTPTRADRSVLLAGLAGLRPTKRPELSTQFATSGGGGGSGVGRKPGVAKRTLIGGN